MLRVPRILPSKFNKQASERSLTEILLIVIILSSLVLSLGFAVSKLEKRGIAMTYQECRADKDSVLLDNRQPRECVTGDGRKFINPEDQWVCGRVGWLTNPKSCK